MQLPQTASLAVERNKSGANPIGLGAVARSEEVIPMEAANRNLSLEELRGEYAWAIAIVKGRFETGLGEISDRGFLDQRYVEFKHRNDPIYADLLGGMGDDQLARTFVSYWVIAQTIATQSRFWLEAAVAEIVAYQAHEGWRPAARIYSHDRPAQRSQTARQAGDLFGDSRSACFTEGLPGEAPLPRNVLQLIDVLVGEQDRESPSVRQRFHRRELSREEDASARSATGSIWHRSPIQSRGCRRT